MGHDRPRKTMTNQITGYHFTGATLRNGEPIPPIGEWLIHTGEISPCSSGLHASVKVFDALQYAPGPMLHKVILAGELQPHGDPVDKYVGRKRKILATIDATQLLWDFARWCALSVADKWDCPPTVRKYLETGDETLRDAAWGAAWGAARAAARAAAWADAWADARADARDDARDAARDAARAAARDAARAAAWDAARADARDAAWDAAWDAASDAQSKHLQSMVKEEMKGL
jgi:hypothetical protein